jgi:hypothetical protein
MTVIKRMRPPPAAPGTPAAANTRAAGQGTETTGDPLARALLACAVTGRAVAKSIADLAQSIAALTEAVRQMQTGGNRHDG